LKLVFLIDSPRRIGGGDYAQFYFAKKLAEKGHQITIFARDKNFFSSELKNIKNLKIFYYRSIPLFVKRLGIGFFNNIWSWIYTSTITKSFISKNKPNFIVGYLRDSAIKAVFLGKKTNTKVANFIFETPPWMERDLPDEWKIELKNKKFKQSWEETKLAYEESDVLIPNSKLAGFMCRKWLPGTNISKPVYPGIDFSNIPKLNQEKRIFDIIYVGRLNILKNVNEILEAGRMINKSLKIVIVGSGEELPKLKKLSETYGLDVTFKGAVSDEEKWMLYQQSELLVFPTSHEGFGMPPLEALACGCKVICSDLAIFKEVYGTEVGYFPLHDVKKLSLKISNVLNNEQKTKKSKLIDKYSWENSVRTIESILRTVK